MSRPQKPTPLRFCTACGRKLERKRFNGVLEDLSRFKQRKYCDQLCMGAGMEGSIKVVSARNSRRQSAKQVAKCCSRCGRFGKRLYVHHQDENPLNNDPSNLMTLCGSCHRRSHSPNFDPITGLRKPCTLCSKPAVRKGLCHAHRGRRQKFGDPSLTQIKAGSSYVLVSSAELQSRRFFVRK